MAELREQSQWFEIGGSTTNRRRITHSAQLIMSILSKHDIACEFNADESDCFAILGTRFCHSSDRRACYQCSIGKRKRIFMLFWHRCIVVQAVEDRASKGGRVSLSCINHLVVVW